MELRPEDFQHSWANALVHAMSVALDLSREFGTAQARADASREELVALAERIPTWLDEAAKRLATVADVQISRIEHAHSELLDTQQTSLRQFQAEREFLDKQRRELDAKLLEFYQAQAKVQEATKELERQRAAFNKLGLWDRIFSKV